MNKPKIATEKTYRELHHELYYGSQFTFAEMEAARELAHRGNYATLKRALNGKRRFTRAAARHCLRGII